MTVLVPTEQSALTVLTYEQTTWQHQASENTWPEVNTPPATRGLQEIQWIFFFDTGIPHHWQAIFSMQKWLLKVKDGAVPCYFSMNQIKPAVVIVIYQAVGGSCNQTDARLSYPHVCLGIFNQRIETYIDNNICKLLQSSQKENMPQVTILPQFQQQSWSWGGGWIIGWLPLKMRRFIWQWCV